MAHLGDDPTVWHEAVLPSIETLKSLSVTIQKAFSFCSDGAFEYEVLGCRAPGYRVRLRDLLACGITRFRYLQIGARKQQVEIVIVPLPPTHLEHSAAGSREHPCGTIR